MPFGVVAIWHPKPGCESEVEQLLLEMQRHTVEEPGCLVYVLHRRDDPAGFFLYEQYVDRAAVDAHHATPYYLELVRGRAPDLLEGRDIVRGDTL
ncbi:MAG TPA: putative quinol monooxygenase [Solirubrobacteraceae bacterium]|jgi:quinol monooxygenase YgiN|nr:putative quinol monooxygenase [Solirubrobacteraceae bacterium]